MISSKLIGLLLSFQTCLSHIMSFVFFSRYEAGIVIKNMCFKDLALGDVLQILNMLITHKKWIAHHPSGWQPLNIALPETNPGSGVVAEV